MDDSVLFIVTLRDDVIREIPVSSYEKAVELVHSMGKAQSEGLYGYMIMSEDDSYAFFINFDHLMSIDIITLDENGYYDIVDHNKEDQIH